MNNERTLLTSEVLTQRKDSLLRIANAVQELIDNPELSMTECFRKHNLHYLNTRQILVALERSDLSKKMKPVEFRTEAGRYDTYALPEEELYMKVFGIPKNERQKISFPEDYKEAIAFVFKHKLTPNETFIVKSRCGYFGIKKTLEEIGGELELSRERIRQIEQQAFRKLRHPSVSDILSCGLKNYNEEQGQRTKEALTKEEEWKFRTTELWDDIKKCPDEELINTFLFITRISDLDLSPRSRNSLLRNKMTTLFDAYSLSSEEMSNLRSLGVACKKEIETKLEEVAKLHNTSRNEISDFCRNLVAKYNLTYTHYSSRGYHFKTLMEDHELTQASKTFTV